MAFLAKGDQSQNIPALLVNPVQDKNLKIRETPVRSRTKSLFDSITFISRIQVEEIPTPVSSSWRSLFHCCEKEFSCRTAIFLVANLLCHFPVAKEKMVGDGGLGPSTSTV